MKRYVTFYEGKTVGIFHVLSQLENCDMSFADYGDLNYAERQLNEHLAVPNYEPGIETEAWFTEEGATRFSEEVDILMVLIENYLNCPVYELDKRDEKGTVLYSDVYQKIYARKEK